MDVLRGRGTRPSAHPRRPHNSYAIITGLLCGACQQSLAAFKTDGGVKIGCDNAECYLKGTLFKRPSVMLVPSAGAHILSES